MKNMPRRLLLAGLAFLAIGPGVDSTPAQRLSPTNNLPPSSNAVRPADEIEGELEIDVECADDYTKTSYVLKSGDRRIALTFAREASLNLKSGQHILVRGNHRGKDAFKVEEEPSILERGMNSLGESNAASAAAVVGERKVLVLLVNFQDNQTQPFTPAQAADLVFNTARSTSVTNYVREASYGKTWVTGDAFGWYTLPMAGDCNAIGNIATYAKQAAVNAGVNTANYQHIVYFFPNLGCSYSGTSVVGGNEVWVAGYMNLRTFAHELGHNFGLYHSAALDCGADVVGANCTTIGYGHQADVLGLAGVTGHFNAYQKERIGWLNSAGSPSVLTVTTSGTYPISPMSAQDSGYKGIRVLKSTDASGVSTWYYLELRQASGFDSFVSGNPAFTGGIFVNLDTDSDGTKNYLLDMTPATSAWTDATLLLNRTYTDSAAGVSFTPVSVGTSGASINVTIGSSPAPAPTCTLAAPTVALASIPTTLPVGASGAYSLTVTNNNSSACTANTFALQPSVPAGWAANGSSFTVAPGTSMVVSSQVGVPSNAAGGTYPLAFGVVNSSNTSTAANAPTQVSVVSALATTATATQASFTSLQTAVVNFAAFGNGLPLSNVGATYSFVRPDGSVAATGSVVTGVDGKALVSYKFNKRKDLFGSYTVRFTAKYGVLTSSSTTSYSVLK